MVEYYDYVCTVLYADLEFFDLLCSSMVNSAGNGQMVLNHPIHDHHIYTSVHVHSIYYSYICYHLMDIPDNMFYIHRLHIMQHNVLRDDDKK